jgi:hypothetical protein
MHFRQKLQEAYEAGYNSEMNEQYIPDPLRRNPLPPLPSWNAIVNLLRSQFDNDGNPLPQQNNYAIDLYDYNGDGTIDQFDLEFAIAMAELYPDRPFTNDVGGDVYQQWFITTYSRPLPPRKIRDPRLSRKMKKKRMQGPYGPGGGRPFGPGGQGS